MSGWRHLGTSLELATSLECGGAGDDLGLLPAQTQIKLVSAGGLRSGLSQLIEGEILPRLMLAHCRFRPESQDESTPASTRPSQGEVDGLCALLLDPVGDDLTASVLTLLEDRFSLEILLLHLLVPAARQLGRMWEEDECDFVEVTVAIGRLQAVTRELCARLESRNVPNEGRSVLLLPCPGETHTFALSIVASFFREGGWTVTTVGAGSDYDIADLVRHEWFDVIGLTLSCDVFVPALAGSIRDLRKASCNRNVRILLGGPFFARHPGHADLFGADAVAEDGRIAPRIAQSLLEKRALAC